ncbi:MAG TPA: STAS domain-containing protein [Acidimicrobiales bacterium]|nr:STAS domain-containing protein [Acidimicrobiales bacterium]
MRITAAEDPGECVAVVEGEVDLLSAPLVAEHLASCVGGGCRRLTVDLSGVSFLGASGLSVLVAASEDLGRSGGLLVLHRSRPLTRRMFAITGIDQLPHIEVSDCSVVSDDR